MKTQYIVPYINKFKKISDIIFRSSYTNTVSYIPFLNDSTKYHLPLPPNTCRNLVIQCKDSASFAKLFAPSGFQQFNYYILSKHCFLTKREKMLTALFMYVFCFVLCFFPLTHTPMHQLCPWLKKQCLQEIISCFFLSLIY